MDYAAVMESAFLDELEKISAAKGKLRRASNARKGRRPLRVSTMLKKEKDGTLFKYTKQAGEGSGGNVVPYSNSDYQSSTGASGPTGSPARGQPGPNDIVTSREDGREAMSTKIPAFARISLAPAAVNEPAEHGNF